MPRCPDLRCDCDGRRSPLSLAASPHRAQYTLTNFLRRLGLTEGKNGALRGSSAPRNYSRPLFIDRASVVIVSKAPPTRTLTEDCYRGCKVKQQPPLPPSTVRESSTITAISHMLETVASSIDMLSRMVSVTSLCPLSCSME